MGTWYKVDRSGQFPEPVEVVKSTTSRVWFMEKAWSGKVVQRMANKHSWHSDFYETEDEAVQAIRKRYEMQIEGMSRQLNDARSRLGELKKRYSLS